MISFPNRGVLASFTGDYIARMEDVGVATCQQRKDQDEQKILHAFTPIICNAVALTNATRFNHPLVNFA